MLVFSGGQYFFIDESHRFHPCIVVIGEIVNGRWMGALDVIAPRHGHMGFFLIGIPIAAVYQYVAGYSGYENLWIPALMLSVASVIVIALTYLVARKAGARPVEALLAASLLACATSFFYYSRHILPYDSSFALVMLALWLALDERPSFARAMLFGFVASFASLAYYGYLITTLTVGLVYALRSRDRRDFFTRAFGSALAFAILPIALYLLTVWRNAPRFFTAYVTFVQMANQGDYAEGWRLTWAYLWHAEHGMLLFWLVGTAIAAWAWLRTPSDSPAAAAARRGALGVALAVGIYALLSFNSTVLHKSVVLGRFARQLVPFFCLATAAAVVQLAPRGRRGRIRLAVVGALVVAQAALNFRAPLEQEFPIGLDRRVAAALQGDVARDISITGPEGFTDWITNVDRPSRYVLLNTTTFLYPVYGAKESTADGTVLLRERHPLQYLPYQYELFTPAERAVLRATDISMRLVDTTGPGDDDARVQEAAAPRE